MADQNGAYTLQGLPPGHHTLTPTLKGYQFYPPSVTVTVMDANVTAPIFVGRPTRQKRSFCRWYKHGASTAVVVDREP